VWGRSGRFGLNIVFAGEHFDLNLMALGRVRFGEIRLTFILKFGFYLEENTLLLCCIDKSVSL
jgi:hypothetical protein